ncbi:hypothetical protein [Ligilactobacillus ruminis]|uniref:hypothetical protein n=1 Tax=Ligilactobacillus ruminis TaxID=1623 RepID=UPI00325C14E7
MKKCSIRITLTVVGLSRFVAVWQARDAQRWIWQKFQLRAKREKQGVARKSEIADKTHQSAHWVLAQGRFL